MKPLTLLLTLGSLLSTAHAQTAPAKPQAAQQAPTTPQAARALAVVTANGKAIGRAFKEKSQPTDIWMPLPVRPVKK